MTAATYCTFCATHHPPISPAPSRGNPTVETTADQPNNGSNPDRGLRSYEHIDPDGGDQRVPAQRGQ